MAGNDQVAVLKCDWRAAVRMKHNLPNDILHHRLRPAQKARARGREECGQKLWLEVPGGPSSVRILEKFNDAKLRGRDSSFVVAGNGIASPEYKNLADVKKIGVFWFWFY